MKRAAAFLVLCTLNCSVIHPTSGISVDRIAAVLFILFLLLIALLPSGRRRR